VSGSGISRTICKSAPCSRQTTTPAPHHSVFYRPDALPAAQPTVSKHWGHAVGKQYLTKQFFNWKPSVWVKYSKPLSGGLAGVPRPRWRLDFHQLPGQNGRRRSPYSVGMIQHTAELSLSTATNKSIYYTFSTVKTITAHLVQQTLTA